jgi:hypothetical protein
VLENYDFPNDDTIFAALRAIRAWDFNRGAASEEVVAWIVDEAITARLALNAHENVAIQRAALRKASASRQFGRKIKGRLRPESPRQLPRQRLTGFLFADRRLRKVSAGALPWPNLTQIARSLLRRLGEAPRQQVTTSACAPR